MSEDSSNQPPLRLKPRDRSTAEPASNPAVAAAPAAEGPRLSLRPKASADSAPAVNGAETQNSIGTAVPPSPPNGSDIGKIKLRPKTPPISTPVVAPAPASAAPTPGAPAPFVAPAAPNAALAAPASVGEPSTEESVRFKLKPKLDAPSAAASAPPPPPSVAPTAAAASLPSAAIAAEPPPPVGGFIKLSAPSAPAPEALPPVDLSAVRLKPKPPTLAPTAASVPPPTALTPLPPSAPPAVAPPPINSPRPAVPHLRASASAPARSPARTAEADDARAFKVGVWVTAALLVLVVGGIGAFAFSFFKQKKAAAAAAVAAHVAPAAPKPSAPKPAPEPEALPPGQPVVEHPQSLPGQLVGKARDVIAEYDKAAGGVDDVLGDNNSSAPKPQVRPSSPVPAPSAAVVGTGGEEPGTGVATPAPEPAPAAVQKVAPPPGPQFRAFVVNLRINGVFQGASARALLNGRMVRVGDTVDSSLHIVLHDVDPQRKLLIFQDDTGAIMPRRY